jgi:uncharacterized membrane protein YcaP (DUF421 family)
MVIISIRSLILFTLIVCGLRLMGKRQVGQLQPYELVVIILISELAAVPMENSGIPLLAGILPILILLISSIALSYITMKHEKARTLICGRPSILIERGQIIYPKLKKLRYNLSDLLEQLRVKNSPNIADVEFAILETNGELSVIPKSQKRPVTPVDMKLATQFEGLPYVLVMDGKIQKENLQKAKKTENWLEKELKKQNITKMSEVLLVSLDSSNSLYIQKKQDPKKLN